MGLFLGLGFSKKKQPPEKVVLNHSSIFGLLFLKKCICCPYLILVVLLKSMLKHLEAMVESHFDRATSGIRTPSTVRLVPLLCTWVAAAGKLGSA